MSLIGTVFSIRSRNKSIFAVHCPNKIDICNMTTIFFCNGFIIYITYVIPMDHDTHLVWKIKLNQYILNDLVCNMLSVQIFYSIFMKLFDRFGKFILFVILSHPAKLLMNGRQPWHGLQSAMKHNKSCLKSVQWSRT